MINQTVNLTIHIPAPVREILDKLKDGGYEAYIVGGCVRDALLGRKPGDWDITTSALPLEVKSLFHNTVDTGIQHGTVMVILQGNGYEVTTYRLDGEYLDSRHPSSVTFTRSLEEDLKRRDFTINAFAWDENGLIDLFDGLRDLKERVIRCVGDPFERFREDALRIMRAVRFSAQLGFSIAPDTGRMITVYAGKLADISRERIRVEWEKTLLSSHPDMVNDYADYGLAPYILPSCFAKCFDRSKEPALLEICRRREKDPEGERYRRLLLTAFFDNLTPEEADQAFRELKYDNVTRKAVTDILQFKDTRIPPDRVSMKLALNRMGQETLEAVLEYRDVWLRAGGNISRKEDPQKPEGELRTLRELLKEVLQSGEPWQISQLAVNGRDLLAAGVPGGEKVGKFLKLILQKVIQSPTLNNREVLTSQDFLSEVEHEFRRSV